MLEKNKKIDFHRRFRKSDRKHASYSGAMKILSLYLSMYIGTYIGLFDNNRMWDVHY